MLATADSSGKVDAAVYARPHFFDENTIAFIMREKLTHANLQTNPHRHLSIYQSGSGYAGKRLYLTKLREETNEELWPAFAVDVIIQCSQDNSRGTSSSSQ